MCSLVISASLTVSRILVLELVEQVVECFRHTLVLVFLGYSSLVFDIVGHLGSSQHQVVSPVLGARRQALLAKELPEARRLVSLHFDSKSEALDVLPLLLVTRHELQFLVQHPLSERSQDTQGSEDFVLFKLLAQPQVQGDRRGDNVHLMLTQHGTVDAVELELVHLQVVLLLQTCLHSFSSISTTRMLSLKLDARFLLERDSEDVALVRVELLLVLPLLELDLSDRVVYAV